MFFSFPDDAHWNEDERAVEFTVRIGEYEGRVRIPRQVFQSLLGTGPTPENCVAAYHLHRTRFERAVEAKLRRRELTADGNIELSRRDLAPDRE
jgi:hypothetical protein